MWLDIVTYLHHHGYETKLPWYRGKVNFFCLCFKKRNVFCIVLMYKTVLFFQEWSYLRGGLTTIDRDYGWFNKIHHDIGTHVIHHLFPQIPHYHLVEAVCSPLLEQIGFFICCFICWFWTIDFKYLRAWIIILQTKAAKHVLGKYYREPEKSGPIPFHLANILTASMKEDHYVSDTGDIVYYQTDSKRPRFYEKMKSS